ncbi:MAG TPA: glycosyltransferase family 4 protein [Gemmataceae bacterium]|nr:glycosyltransferase family 4 protein [Gemmataceae bacterium]
MKIALCYENVLPARGGCETYIADLARRLAADRHEVHLYACRWDERALPPGLRYHALPAPRGPRFLRPWRFAAALERALAEGCHDVSMGFDKTWGQDILYPQGGLHSASAEHNLHKYPPGPMRSFARVIKALDLANWSYRRLERRQYLRAPRPLIIVNSLMVRGHFEQFHGIGADAIRVVRSAIDPRRFPEHDRLRCRLQARQQWGIGAGETVALFAAMNYHLKGLEPLLHALRRLHAHADRTPLPQRFRLLVVGDPDSRAYQRLAQRLGIAEHVCFAGHCPEMRNAYFAADFLVHPTFYDPCSLVVLEALACALPVITSRANGASELLHPLQEGYVIDDPHDDERLAWCLAQLLDPARRAACAAAARRAASRWTFEHHYRQLLQVFTEAVARKRAA